MQRILSIVSRKLLRVGLGITFLWIGVLIVRDPASWAGLIPAWMSPVAPDATAAMFQSGVLDIAIGLLLILGLWTWLAAILAFLHLIVVLASVLSVQAWDIAARDVGLLFASAALFLEAKKPAFLVRSLARFLRRGDG